MDSKRKRNHNIIIETSVENLQKVKDILKNQKYEILKDTSCELLQNEPINIKYVASNERHAKQTLRQLKSLDAKVCIVKAGRLRGYKKNTRRNEFVEIKRLPGGTHGTGKGN